MKKTTKKPASVDKTALCAKSMATLETLHRIAHTRAQAFGTKGDFDSNEAKRAFRLAVLLWAPHDSLKSLEYLRAYSKVGEIGYQSMIELGLISLGAPQELVSDMRLLTVPQVGDGATVSYVTDRYAATVVKVSANAGTIVVQRDMATNTAIWPEQNYLYERAPGGQIWNARKSPRGHYQLVKATGVVTIGPRSQYVAPEN